MEGVGRGIKIYIKKKKKQDRKIRVMTVLGVLFKPNT